VLAWIKVPRPHPNPPPKGEGERGTRLRSGAVAPSPAGAPRLTPSPAGGGLGWGQEFLRAYKISKRYDDDISAVCLVVNLTLNHGKVAKISIGAGGVAPTPARAVKTQAFLLGRPWTRDTAGEAATVLRAEFQPISDMRASAAYRSAVLGNLMQRFWLESQGMDAINLERFALEESA
jgi:xanthine dehydrogenase small subunit